MTFKTYKLHFTAPLHIGNHRSDESISIKTIQSDTLYAALTACLAKMGEDFPANGDFEFTISSLFPFYQRKDNDDGNIVPVYFLPMPLQTRLPQLKDVALAKKVKKVQWVDCKLYDHLLQGECFFGGENDMTGQIQGPYLTETLLPQDKDGSRDFIKSDVIQRASVADRTGQGDAMPFYINRITFRDESGLYFLATGNTELLDKALRLLKEEGLGTDRHIGFGYFDVEKGSLDINTPESASHMVSLSFFIPESEKHLEELLASDHVAYDFVRRGGWITTEPYNTLRKNVIYGFLPGSVFHNKRKEQQEESGEQQEEQGKIVDLKPTIGNLTPSHSIWRNGKSIMLPIKFENHGENQ